MSGLTTYQDASRREDLKGGVNKKMKKGKASLAGRRLARKAYKTAAKKSPPGAGGRFAALAKSAAASGASNPGAVAAAIGRKKYGKAAFQKMAARGRKKG